MPEENQPAINVGNIASVLDRMFEKDPNAVVVPPVEKVVPEVVEVPPVETVVPEPEPVVDDGKPNPWKNLRKAHEETKKELGTLKEQLAEFEGTKAERDQLKAQIADYTTQMEQLKKVDSIAKLENDPQFQSKYVQGREKVVSKLNELAGYADIDPGSILSAMSKPPKERYAALDDALSLATPTLAGKIRAEVDRLEALDSEKAAEYDNAQVAIDKLKAERIRKQEQEQADHETRADHAFKTTSENLSKELKAQGIELDEATINKARDFFKTNGSTEEAAKVVIRAFAAEGAFGKAAEAQKKIEELTAELGKYQESNPGLGGGLNGGPTKAADDVDFVTAIRQGVKSLGLNR